MTQRKPVQRQTTSPSNAASALQLQVTSVPVGLSDREHPAPGVTPMDSSLIPTAGDNRRLVMGYESIGRLQLNPRDPRTYSPTEQRRVGKALKRFGAIPLIVTAERIMLSGNIWLEAAKLAGFTEVPVIVADHLSPSEADAFTKPMAEWEHFIARSTNWFSCLRLALHPTSTPLVSAIRAGTGRMFGIMPASTRSVQGVLRNWNSIPRSSRLT